MQEVQYLFQDFRLTHGAGQPYPPVSSPCKCFLLKEVKQMEGKDCWRQEYLVGFKFISSCTTQDAIFYAFPFSELS